MLVAGTPRLLMWWSARLRSEMLRGRSADRLHVAPLTISNYSCTTPAMPCMLHVARSSQAKHTPNVRHSMY